MQFQNEHELRAFLRLCIDPGPGRDKRTPVRMTAVLPGPALTALDRLAPPYLRAFRKTAADLAEEAARMSYAYATAVLAWIREEETTDELHALVVDASAHGGHCRRCASGGTLAADCEEAARLATALLAPAAAVPHAETPQAEPATAAALGHATVEETAAAYVAAAPEAEQQGDDWPAALRTPDGRVWTRATAPETAGADLYESPTSPSRYTPAALLALYGQLATTSTARSTADTGPLKDYARVCRDNHLVPFTTALVHSSYSNAGDTLRAAVHISLEPGLELDTTAVDQVRYAVADGLTTRE